MERDILKKQRPTSRVTKSKISIYPGAFRIPFGEVGRNPANRANRILCLAQECFYAEKIMILYRRESH